MIVSGRPERTKSGFPGPVPAGPGTGPGTWFCCFKLLVVSQNLSQDPQDQSQHRGLVLGLLRISPALPGPVLGPVSGLGPVLGPVWEAGPVNPGSRGSLDLFCKRVQYVESTRARLGPAWIGSQVPVPAGDRSRATSGGPVSGRPRERRQLEVTWAQAGPSGN